MTFNIINIGFDGTFGSPFANRTGYINNGDENDIFYFLGTNFGQSIWSNPNGNGQITVTDYSLPLSNPTRLTDNSISSTTSPNGSAADTGFVIEFNNCKVALTRADIYQYNGDGFTRNLQNEYLEVSQDGSSWEVLNFIAGPTSISAMSGGWFNIYDSESVGYYSHIRYRRDTLSAFLFGFREIKYYGKILRTDNDIASSITPPTVLSDLPDTELSSLSDGDILLYQNSRAFNQQPLLYDVANVTMSSTLNLSINKFPNYYILDPNGSNRLINLPNPVDNNQFFRIKNIDTAFNLDVDDGGGVIATIGGITNMGDFLYNGSDWTVILY